MSNSAFSLPQPANGEHGPYALVGMARAKPGMEEALDAMLVSLVARTRLEPGCLEYHVHRDRAEPGLFVFYEAWTDSDALLLHLQKPYIQAFLAQRMDFLATDMDVRWLQMASPYPNAAASANGAVAPLAQ